jgi:hypothetical protein
VKTNETLQFGLEAAREVGVITMGSNRGFISTTLSLSIKTQAAIFKGAPKALRGAKLRHRIFKLG